MSTQLDDDGELTAFGLPISTEPEDIQAEIHADLQERMPGWAPLPGHPLTHFAGTLATTAADSRDALQARMRSTLLDLLGTLFRVPRLDGAPASSTLTITARDLLGHTAAAPIPVTLGDVELEIPIDVVVPVGETTVVVPVVAVEFGDEPNGAAGAVEMTGLDWLAETDPVVLDAPLAGGSAPETDDAYAVRMVDELQTMSSALIHPRDYSIAARRHPGVGFAWTLPHYNAATNDDAAVFHLTTVAGNSDAGPLTEATATAVTADFGPRLLDNVVHHLVAPTLVPIDVTAVVVARPGFDLADVEAAVAARLGAVLAPANWATPRYGDDPNPIPSALVHVNELIARVDEVESVDHVASLQIGDGSQDAVALTVRELPTPGTLDVTATDE